MTKARVNADNASADIQGVTAGTGLSGGGTSGTVTLTNDMATTIAAKGDLVVGTGNDTYSALTVGEQGATIVADSAATTGLRWQGNYAAGKNKIINGDFSIWQRGTSFNSAYFNGGSTYHSDRFTQLWNAVPTSVTVSRESFTPGTAPVAGYESAFFWRSTITTVGSTTVWGLMQKIEDVRTLANQTVTVSFWGKADTNRTANVFVIQSFGTGGSSDVAASTSINLTNAWQRFTYTLTLGSMSGKTIGANSSLIFRIDQAIAAGSVLDIWGVQLEAGSVATAFQTATGTLQGELAACQRYYQRLDSTENNFTPFMFGAGTNTTNIRFFANLPVSMRTSGNVTVSAFGTFTTGNGNAAITAVGGGFMRNRNTLLVDMTTNSANVQRSAYSLEANNSATASIQIDSEL